VGRWFPGPGGRGSSGLGSPLRRGGSPRFLPPGRPSCRYHARRRWRREQFFRRWVPGSEARNISGRRGFHVSQSAHFLKASSIAGFVHNRSGHPCKDRGLGKGGARPGGEPGLRTNPRRFPKAELARRPPPVRYQGAGPAPGNRRADGEARHSAIARILHRVKLLLMTTVFRSGSFHRLALEPKLAQWKNSR